MLPARLGLIPQQYPSRFKDLAYAKDITDLIATQMTWIRHHEYQTLCRDKGIEPIRRLFEPHWTHNLPSNSLIERSSALLTEVQIRLRLANDYLPKVDIASMRHSLEVRVPMLDEELFNFGLSLPHYLKVGEGMGKRVLRKIAYRKLPTNVASKPKHGFEMPIDRWVDNDFRQRLRTLLLGSKSVLPDFFNPAVYIPMVEAFSDQRQLPAISRVGLYQRIVMLLAIQVHFGNV